MNLTEPQAGSDLSAIQARAEPQADGTYRLFGQKIFISWGEHDLSNNIVHLVLARTPDAPPGVKGISVFLAPKFLLGPQGELAARNDVFCASVERKVGQHASPSCTMIYGGGPPNADGTSGAVGYLVGDLHRGLETMFIMMNDARFGVGIEGLAVAERSFQTARGFALERIQGSEVGAASHVKVPIVRHPDVLRMLMRMKAATEGMRALMVVIATAMDIAKSPAPTSAVGDAQALIELLTPVFKGWNTETAAQLSGLGVQIHGGLGYMDDCIASQLWREARILTIYEGTTAIQANDLVGRKIARDGGRSSRKLAEWIRHTAAELFEDADVADLGAALEEAATAVDNAIDYVVANYHERPKEVLALAVTILDVFGTAAVGWQLGRSAHAAKRLLAGGQGNAEWLSAKIATARFYADHELPRLQGAIAELRRGGASVLAAEENQL